MIVPPNLDPRWVITYFICLAGFYGVKAAMVIENANQPFIEVPR